MKFIDLIPSFAVILDGGTTPSDIITPILVAIIGAIATIIASTTFPTLLDRLSSVLQASKHKPVGLAEASTLKILQVRLESLDKKEWGKTKNKYLKLIIVSVISTLILYAFAVFSSLYNIPTTISRPFNSLTISIIFSFFFYILYFQLLFKC
jgi:hypothetical protein